MGEERRAGQAAASPTSDELRRRLDLRMCFLWIPALGLSACSLGEEGPFGCREQPSLAWPDDHLWSVEFHWDGTWTPSLCLDPWVWFWGKSAPNPPMRVSQQRALLRKKRTVCFHFKNYALKYEKVRGSTFYCITSNKLHTGWHLPKSLDSTLCCDW